MTHANRNGRRDMTALTRRATAALRRPGHWTLPLAALVGGFVGGAAGYLIATSLGL